MAERGVEGRAEEDTERGGDTASLVPITLWKKQASRRIYAKFKAEVGLKRHSDAARTHLVYAGFDPHHDGVSEHLPILRQCFPGLQSGLVLEMHPVTRRGHLPTHHQNIHLFVLLSDQYVATVIVRLSPCV